MLSQTHQRRDRRSLCRGRRDGFDLGTVLPLVRREVGRFRPWRLERDDLMQAGVAGALEAWHRRDQSRDSGTGAYTRAWVRKELQQTVARGDFTVAVPTHVPARATALRRHLDHEGTITRAGRQMGLTAEQTLSLDRLLEQSPDGTARIAAHDLVAPDPLVEDVVLADLDRDAVRHALESLAEPHRLVVALRFGFDGSTGRSTREIGRLVGVSDFTVRLQLKQATALLRTQLAHIHDLDVNPR